MLSASVALAQISVGITPLYSRQTTNNSYLNQSFTDAGTKIELDAGIVVKNATFRGYYLFKNTYINTSSVFDPIDKKNLPIQFDSCFGASRVEIGLPLFYPTFMIEPFFINSFTKNCFSISGEKVNYSDNITNNSQGLGIFLSHTFASYSNFPKQNISIKYYTTSKDNLIDLRYNRFTNKNSFGFGYTFRTYDNVTVDGPFLNIMYIF
jgi:hypothetical protein